MLAADVGATRTRLALFGSQPEPRALEVFRSAEHRSLVEIVERFRARHPGPLAAATVGVAGPVRDGRSEMVNLDWPVDAGALAAALELPSDRARVINDLEASAWGIEALGPDDLVVLNDVAGEKGGMLALVWLGTGLGQAFISSGAAGPVVHASEGGHVDFAARSELESELRTWVARGDTHVSTEDVCSGSGLLKVYAFLRSRAAGPEPEWLAAERHAGDPAAAISRAALAGRDPVAEQALDLMVSIYGTQAGNLALTVMATGGVYLGGGIVPRILPRLRDGLFMASFVDKGRLSGVVEAIPVRAILNDRIGLIGAALHAKAALGGGE